MQRGLLPPPRLPPYGRVARRPTCATSTHGRPGHHELTSSRRGAAGELLPRSDTEPRKIEDAGSGALRRSYGERHRDQVALRDGIGTSTGHAQRRARSGDGLVLTETRGMGHSTAIKRRGLRGRGEGGGGPDGDANRVQRSALEVGVTRDGHQGLGSSATRGSGAASVSRRARAAKVPAFTGRVDLVRRGSSPAASPARANRRAHVPDRRQSRQGLADLGLDAETSGGCCSPLPGEGPGSCSRRCARAEPCAVAIGEMWYDTAVAVEIGRQGRPRESGSDGRQ